MPISLAEYESEEIKSNVTIAHKDVSEDSPIQPETQLKSPQAAPKEYSWLVSGEHYSKRKRKLKAIYSKHGLDWAGNFFTNNFIWRNKKTEEEVRNEYERDEAKELTKRVTITAKIANTKLLAEMAAVIIPGVVKPDTDELLAAVDSRFKGQIERMQREVDRGKMGAAAWLRMVKTDYEEQRRKILEGVEN